MMQQLGAQLVDAVLRHHHNAAVVRDHNVTGIHDHAPAAYRIIYFPRCPMERTHDGGAARVYRVIHLAKPTLIAYIPIDDETRDASVSRFHTNGVAEHSVSLGT